MLFDYSKQLVTDETVSALLKLAEARGVPAALEAMRTGREINFTEHRAVLHAALRAGKDSKVGGRQSQFYWD
jgi:glucose-6-phosphate isomerase